MGPPGFGARLLTIVPSGNQQLPEDLGTHASVGEQVRREGRDDGSMISPSIAISSQGSRGCTKPGTSTRCSRVDRASVVDGLRRRRRSRSSVVCGVVADLYRRDPDIG